MSESETMPHPRPEGGDIAYPIYPDSLPAGVLQGGRYYLRFASSEADLRAIQRLRFEVFNLELDEGLDSAYVLGRDEDEFDVTCHHLMVVHKGTEQVVGTYRIMTHPMARDRGGFYSETEFDFSSLPVSVLERCIEVGRACVASDHRNGRVLNLLWRGLARYLTWNDKRYLFGCCSVPTLDEAVGESIFRRLKQDNHLHPEVMLKPLPPLQSNGRAEEAKGDVPLPPLFQSYLKIGAKVCSPPAVDRRFKVIDFFVLLDLEQLDEAVQRTFFGRDRWIEAGDA
ncbi:MAG: GNAT family N-acyltransferase [Myxococcota bacterium]